MGEERRESAGAGAGEGLDHAYEKIEHHEGEGANFLFNDGHVEWVAKDQAKKMIAELEAGENPPKSFVSPPMDTDAHR